MGVDTGPGLPEPGQVASSAVQFRFFPTVFIGAVDVLEHEECECTVRARNVLRTLLGVFQAGDVTGEYSKLVVLKKGCRLSWPRRGLCLIGHWILRQGFGDSEMPASLVSVDIIFFPACPACSNGRARGLKLLTISC